MAAVERSNALSVLDYGAVPGTDSTAAIQAAIDAAASRLIRAVHIPAGTWIISRPGTDACCLDMRSGVRVFGDGPSTVLKLKTGAGTSDRMIRVWGQHDVTLEDVALDGQDTLQTTLAEQRHGVFVGNGSSNVTCRRLSGGNTSGDFIFYHGGSGGLVEDCVIYGNAAPTYQHNRVGINFQGGRDLIIRNNQVSGYTNSLKSEHDASDGDATDILVTGNVAENITFTSPATGGLTVRCRVLGNTFSKAGKVWIAGTQDCEIANNTFLCGAATQDIALYMPFRNTRLSVHDNSFSAPDSRAWTNAVVLTNNYNSYGNNSDLTITANTFAGKAPCLARFVVAMDRVTFTANHYSRDIRTPWLGVMPAEFVTTPANVGDL